MKDCEKYKKLLMGLIDNELTPEEASELNDHLTRCSSCRDEYEQLRDTASKISNISFIQPHEKELRKLWKSPYSRFTRNSGLFLVFTGWISLILYGLYEFFMSKSEATFSKISIAAIFIGFAVLLASVIRDRIIAYKSDPYKEIEK